jgi:hypothetical protein
MGIPNDMVLWLANLGIVVILVCENYLLFKNDFSRISNIKYLKQKYKWIYDLMKGPSAKDDNEVENTTASAQDSADVVSEVIDSVSNDENHEIIDNEESSAEDTFSYTTIAINVTTFRRFKECEFSILNIHVPESVCFDKTDTTIIKALNLDIHNTETDNTTPLSSSSRDKLDPMKATTRKSMNMNITGNNNVRDTFSATDTALSEELVNVRLNYATRIVMSSKVLPNIPGCEPHSTAAQQMQSKFPDADIVDIVRFLIARKGDVALATEMMTKALAWHSSNFPLKRSPEILAAINTRCFFQFGQARDGTPVVYFRGSLYDNTKASADTFVLLAAHIIDYTIKFYGSLNVAVFVHSVSVPGAPNAPADMDFIKKFISTLSDNYPERLKRLIMYPFPWYGRALWSVLKMFVDKRTQGTHSLTYSLTHLTTYSLTHSRQSIVSLERLY